MLEDEGGDDIRGEDYWGTWETKQLEEKRLREYSKV